MYDAAVGQPLVFFFSKPTRITRRRCLSLHSLLLAEFPQLRGPLSRITVVLEIGSMLLQKSLHCGFVVLALHRRIVLVPVFVGTVEFGVGQNLCWTKKSLEQKLF